jgi:hypothetical protein
MHTVVSADTPSANATTTSDSETGALRSKTCVSQRDRDSRLLSPELTFKTEGLCTSTLSSSNRASSKWNKGCRNVNSPFF